MTNSTRTCCGPHLFIENVNDEGRNVASCDSGPLYREYARRPSKHRFGFTLGAQPTGLRSLRALFPKPSCSGYFGLT